MKLNDLDWNKLQVFRVVAQTCSMRVAGEQLYRTPSAVSQSISHLEKQLGFALFDRIGIRLKVTLNGKKLYKLLESQTTEFSELVKSLEAGRRKVSGKVTVGMLPGYPAISISEAAARCLSTYPELNLRYRFLSHTELAKGLVAGDLDVAFSFYPLRQFSDRITSQKLREEELVLAVPKKYALKKIQSAEFLKMQSIPVIDYYQKPLLIEGWLKHHRLKLVPKVRLYAGSLEHVLEMVKRGVGCAVVPRHALQSVALQAGQRKASAQDGEYFDELSIDAAEPWKVKVFTNSVKSRELASFTLQTVIQELSRT